MKESINLPVSLAEWALENERHKELSVYMCFQFQTDGIFHRTQSNQILKGLHGKKSRKTQRKMLDFLVYYNWVGFNPKSGNYWLRSLRNICEGLNLNVVTVVKMTNEDLSNFKCFLQASVLSKKILSQKAAIFLKEKRRKTPAAKKKDAALQESYTGLSKEGISKILKISRTEAVRLKNNAHTAGYLSIKKRYRVIAKLKKPDYNLKNQITEINPELGRKIFFNHDWKTGEIQVCEQRHDEIQTKMVVRRRKNKNGGKKK